MSLDPYRTSEKIIDVVCGVSQDGFQWMRTIIFRDEESFMEWKVDYQILSEIAAMAAHDQRNNIRSRFIRDQRRV